MAAIKPLNITLVEELVGTDLRSVSAFIIICSLFICFFLLLLAMFSLQLLIFNVIKRRYRILFHVAFMLVASSLLMAPEWILMSHRNIRLFDSLRGMLPNVCVAYQLGYSYYLELIGESGTNVAVAMMLVELVFISKSSAKLTHVKRDCFLYANIMITTVMTVVMLSVFPGNNYVGNIIQSVVNLESGIFSTALVVYLVNKEQFPRIATVVLYLLLVSEVCYIVCQTGFLLTQQYVYSYDDASLVVFCGGVVSALVPLPYVFYALRYLLISICLSLMSPSTYLSDK